MSRYRYAAASIIALGLLGGCPDSSTPADSSVVAGDVTYPDLAFWDSAVDLGPDATPRDGGGDVADTGPDSALADLLPEAAAKDVQGWDASLSKATVLYTISKNKDSFGVHKISSDGNGKATQVFGWHGLVDLDDLQLTNLTELFPVNSHVPQVTASAHQDFRGIRLPNKLGTIFYYHRKLNAVSGLLLVKPGGIMKVLLEVSGIYSDTLSQQMAVSQNGERGAIIQGTSGVLLVRTDGKTFAGGKDWVDVTPASGFKMFEPRSLTIAGAWLYCTAKDDKLSDRLLRAPIDGTAKLKPIALPASKGKVPLSISYQLATSATGKYLALSAGSLSTVHDVYVVDVAAGTAKRVTDSPAQISLRGDSFGQLGARLAVSPGGKAVAYVRWQNGTAELFVSSTAAGSKELQVTDDKHFSATITNIYNLLFADDKSLLFSAGQDYYSNDIYIWDHNLKLATNLTAIGSSTIPFDGKGAYYFQGGWVSPNRKWMYMLGYENKAKITNIYGVSLTTFKVVHVTNKANVSSSSDAFVTCEGTGKLYFGAEADVLIHSGEVWSMDQNSGQVATRLTHMTKNYKGSWYISNMVLNSTCSRLAWAAGGGYWLNDLWTMALGGTGKEKRLTPNAMFIAPSVSFTPDGTTLVFGSGGSQNATPLKAITIYGGPLKTLDHTAGYLNIFAVF